ncbi:hypothetical protein NEAUS06_2023 [Nematocida ausubeli]|nr:hypothetical protein NEAUS06_2023 [Nematocida ausubeli]
MEYTVESALITTGTRIYAISYMNGIPMSICSMLSYKKQRVLYIKRFESTAQVKGLSRMVLMENLRSILCTLDGPEVFLYSRPVPCKYIETHKQISHSVDLSGYWHGILAGIGYESMAVGHKEARNGEYKRTIEMYPGITSCFGKVPDEPISRALYHAPNSSIEDIMVILCSSRDLTNGTLLFSRRKVEKTELLKNKKKLIQKVTKQEIKEILASVKAGMNWTHNKKMKITVQKIHSESIERKEPIKPFKLTIKKIKN